MSSSITIRKRRDGSVTITGELPERHTFASRFLHRELESGLVRMQIVIDVDGKPVVYDVEGFELVLDADENPVVDEQTGDLKLNFTGVVARRSSAKAHAAGGGES